MAIKDQKIYTSDYSGKDVPACPTAWWGRQTGSRGALTR